jgi:hypothetical protein
MEQEDSRNSDEETVDVGRGAGSCNDGELKQNYKKEYSCGDGNKIITK